LKLIIGNKNYSSWSLRAWFLLTEAGIEFEEYRIPLDVENTAAEMARFSPAGRVPVLLLDDQPVWDTLAIAETVAEIVAGRFGGPGACAQYFRGNACRVCDIA